MHDIPSRPAAAAEDLDGAEPEANSSVRQSRFRLLHKRALELALSGAALDEVLAVLVRAGADHVNGRGAIFLIDPAARVLRCAAAAGMPESFSRAMAVLDVHLYSPSCAHAAQTGNRVIVADVMQDPLWGSSRDLAREHGIRACWSTPLRSFKGGVLGTFALYHGSPREPRPEELEAIDLLAHTAAILSDRSRLDDESRQADERFRGLFEQTAVGIVHTSFSGQWVMVNRRLAEILGYDRPEELIGRTFTEVTHPDDRAADFPLLQALDAGGITHFQRDKRYLRKDGSAIWVNVTVSLARSPTGAPIYRSGIVLDISERKRAEAEIAASHRELQALYDTAPIGLCMLDREMRFVRVNRRFAEMNGVPPEEHLGRRVGDVVPQLSGVATRLFRRVTRSKQAVIGYEVIGETPARPGLSRSWNESWVPILGLEGEVTGINIVAEETTDRKKSAADLAENAGQLKLILDSAREYAIITLDEDGLITSWNSGAERILGYSEDEALGRHTRIFYTTEDRDAGIPEAELRAALQEGSAGDARWHLRKDGTRFWASGLIQPLAQGGHRGFVKIFRDLTDRKKAEDHARLLTEELNHRVKNTLATVQAIVAQALQGSAAETEVREAVETRLTALSRSHDLLTRESWEGAQLSDIVRQAVEPFSTLADVPGRFQIEGDRIRLSPRAALSLGMALHELATNAAKYGALSLPDGRVRIRWTSVPLPEGDRLRLVWRERGGPPVTPPTRKGFGSRLIERGLALELNGTVRLDYAPEGVTCEIDMPRPQIPAADFKDVQPAGDE